MLKFTPMPLGEVIIRHLATLEAKAGIDDASSFLELGKDYMTEDDFDRATLAFNQAIQVSAEALERVGLLTQIARSKKKLKDVRDLEARAKSLAFSALVRGSSIPLRRTLLRETLSLLEIEI